MYAKCRDLFFAEYMFEKITERNVVTWTVRIVGPRPNLHAGPDRAGTETVGGPFYRTDGPVRRFVME